MADVELVIREHELGNAEIAPPPDRGRPQPPVPRMICRQCYARGLQGPLRDWRDYAEHLAKAIEGGLP